MKKKTFLAGSKHAHVHSLVILKLKGTLHIVALVFVLCVFNLSKLLSPLSAISFTHFVTNVSAQNRDSELVLPFDPPPLSMVLSLALDWAPSATGADTGHLSSPVIEIHKEQHLITVVTERDKPIWYKVVTFLFNEITQLKCAYWKKGSY